VKDPMLSLPVTCPTCGVQRLELFPKIATTMGMDRWNGVWLHSTCHYQQWQASPAEMHDLRVYMQAEAY